jgi:hypothetical protein
MTVSHPRSLPSFAIGDLLTSYEWISGQVKLPPNLSLIYRQFREWTGDNL